MEYYYSRGIPNFPQWRVDEEEKCDPTISSMFGEPVYTQLDLSFYPNPASDLVFINIPAEHREGVLYLFDAPGKVVRHEVYDGISGSYQLDVSAFGAGNYVLEFIPKGVKERVIYSGKVVVF